MSTINEQTEEKLRQGFKSFNVFMIWMWRLGLRRWINFWPSVGGRIMVITHTGRKSGLRRQTPVNYYQEDGTLYLTAGFGPVTDWYRNLLVNPQVEIWLPDGWWAGTAQDISQDDQRLPLLRKVIAASGVVGRMMGLDPVKMSDQDFDQATASYRLVSVRLTRQLRGPGGPGDLAWVWLPIGLAGLCAGLLLRRRK
jgi:deazaflavin-dependent oxidoreductase (nitroreductase family)